MMQSQPRHARPTDISHVSLQTTTTAGNQELWWVSNKVITGRGKIRTSGVRPELAKDSCWWMKLHHSLPPSVSFPWNARRSVGGEAAAAAAAFLSAYTEKQIEKHHWKSDSNNNDPLKVSRVEQLCAGGFMFNLTRPREDQSLVSVAWNIFSVMKSAVSVTRSRLELPFFFVQSWFVYSEQCNVCIRAIRCSALSSRWVPSLLRNVLREREQAQSNDSIISNELSDVKTIKLLNADSFMWVKLQNALSDQLKLCRSLLGFKIKYWNVK